MEDWLATQIRAVTAGWGTAIERHYPDAWPQWKTADANLPLMEAAFFPTLPKVPWDGILNRDGMRALDLGCGSGWLTAWLSRQPNVAMIDALDADLHNLETMLPRMLELMQGDAAKVQPVNALFAPIQRADGYYDLIVASASVHHADDLYTLLKELARVLAPRGTLVIMNEVPRTQDDHCNYMMGHIADIVGRYLELTPPTAETSVSAGSIVYDPLLGDRAYSFLQYHEAITGAGLNYDLIETGNTGGADKFVHYVCAARQPDEHVTQIDQRLVTLAPEIDRRMRRIADIGFDRNVPRLPVPVAAEVGIRGALQLLGVAARRRLRR